jgi:hypothetical protein
MVDQCDGEKIQTLANLSGVKPVFSGGILDRMLYLVTGVNPLIAKIFWYRLRANVLY